MEPIPAIDLMKGKVVRLAKGNPEEKTVYESFGEPITVARRWAGEGARTIHIVDLDAALGLGSNKSIVRQIVDSVGIPVQLGGGIRSVEIARELLSDGVTRVVLGSMAFKETDAVVDLLRDCGADRVAVALDYYRDRVLVKGWKEDTAVKLDEAVGRFIKLGVAVFLVTAVERDGLMVGPDVKTLAGLSAPQRARILAAGGIGSIQDLVNLNRLGLKGAVIGKALYEARFTLRAAIDALND